MQGMAAAAAVELFEECLVKAVAHGLSFSALKTESIGISGLAWEPVVIGNVQMAPVDNIRILGYRINTYLNWSEHHQPKYNFDPYTS